MQITRDRHIITVSVEPEEAPPARRYPHSETTFQPTSGAVELDEHGAVRRVRLDGPSLTAKGKQHATSVSSWEWDPSDYEAEPEWPPSYAPAAAVRVADYVLKEC
jgi:hypothetical protein